MEKEQEKAAKARESALNGALTQIERAFGAGSIMKMGSDEAAVRVEAIPTGALSLDLALGVGGLPRGRIVEVFGPESSGKTTLVYHVLANAQTMGGICAFIDAEHAMDPVYAKRDRRGHRRAARVSARPRRAGARDRRPPDPLRRGRRGGHRLGRRAHAASPSSRAQMGDQTVGLQARMMTQAMRKLAGNLQPGQHPLPASPTRSARR